MKRCGSGKRRSWGRGDIGKVDPALVEGWLRARSVARGLPQPYPAHGGWCVETNSLSEHRRYLFAYASDGLRALAASTFDPHIMLKLCDDSAALKALLPDRWELLKPAEMMVRSDCDPCRLPVGFRAEVSSTNGINCVQLFAAGGAVAASGYAAEGFGVYCYDRIVTEAVYRRRGLGRVVMQCLYELRRDPHSTQILTATQMGRNLYVATGWSTYSAFTTAHIPARDLDMIS